MKTDETMDRENRPDNGSSGDIDIASILSALNDPHDIPAEEVRDERRSEDQYKAELRRLIDGIEAAEKKPARKPENGGISDEEAYYGTADETEAEPEDAGIADPDEARKTPEDDRQQSDEDGQVLILENEIPAEEEDVDDDDPSADDEEFDSNYYSADRENTEPGPETPQLSALADENNFADEEIPDKTEADREPLTDRLHGFPEKLAGLFRKKSPAPSESDTPAEEKAAEKKAPRLNPDIPELETRFGYIGGEYTDPAQTVSVQKAYERDKFITDVRITATALLALILFIFDTFGGKFGGALSAVSYPAVQVLISLQLLLIAAALSYKRVWAGLYGIFTGRPIVNSITSAALVFTVIYDVIIACMNSAGFTLYNFPACFCLLMTVLRDHLTIANEKRNFEKLSSWNSIYTLESSDAVPAGDIKLKRTFRLHNGSFADHYFQRTNRWDPSQKIVTPIICLSLASSLLVLIILAAGHKAGAMQIFNTFMAQFLFTLPAFAAFASVYPFYSLMYRDRKSECIVLSEADAQEYAAVGTLVINEEDFFAKDGSIYVKQMKLCTSSGGCNICDFVPAAYSILRSIGATAALPLYKSIEKLTQDMPQVEEICSLTENGVCGIVGGKKYFIGSAEYLASNGIRALAIRDDHSGAACRSMHIASEEEDLIVYELVYGIKRRFVNNLVKLSNQGIRIVVRCTDPNIDEDLMHALTGKTSTPVKVRKNISDPAALLDEYRAGSGANTGGRIDGGILADGDKLNDLIDRANICAGYKKWSGINLLAMGGAFLIGLVLAFLLGINGVFINAFSFFIVLYQLICMVPSIIISVSKVYL